MCPAEYSIYCQLQHIHIYCVWLSNTCWTASLAIAWLIVPVLCMCLYFLCHILWPEVSVTATFKWIWSCTCNCSVFCICNRSGLPHNVMHSPSICVLVTGTAWSWSGGVQLWLMQPLSRSCVWSIVVWCNAHLLQEGLVQFVKAIFGDKWAIGVKNSGPTTSDQ